MSSSPTPPSSHPGNFYSRLHRLRLPTLELPALPTMKSALRFSKASGSTKRRVERIVRAGLHQTNRSMSARYRRKFSERLNYAR
jgi:hypothetical protein